MQSSKNARLIFQPFDFNTIPIFVWSVREGFLGRVFHMQGSRIQGERRVQTLLLQNARNGSDQHVASKPETDSIALRSVAMQMSLNCLSLQPARIATRAAPSRPSCKVAIRAVAATEREVPAQQLRKPAPHGRLYNFAAGPAVLPVEVLEEAQEGLLNWKGSGTSVMEMSHRGKEFSSIIQQAEDDLRALLKIPDNYQVC